MTFQELNLRPELLTAVETAGFEKPTPIQARAIPLLLAGKNVIGQAQTGTGKTAAYGLPILQIVDGGLQALVLVPTRELAVQTVAQLELLGGSALALYGGQPLFPQTKALKRKPSIVVATPGRLLDHLRRGSLTLEHIRVAVLDEADEMLNFGFMEEVENILSNLPETRQIALFSATFPLKVNKLIATFLTDAARVEIGSTTRTLDSIRQRVLEVRHGARTSALLRVLEQENPEFALVFCRTRIETTELAEKLRQQGLAAECLSGELSQNERDRVMERCRSGQCQLLVATDVAARGLDLDTLSHVINYAMPGDFEQYIHRIGRTGRAGRAGEAISLIEPNERRFLMMLQRFTRSNMQPYRLASAAQLEKARQQRFLESLSERLAQPLPAFLENLSPDLARAALALMWEQSNQGQPLVDEDFTPRERTAWLKVTVGRRDGVRPRDLVGAMAQEMGLSSRHMGTIRIEDRRSYLECAAEPLAAAMRRLPNGRVLGHKVSVCAAAEATGGR